MRRTQLKCSSGHPVVKRKAGLRAWQGRIHDRVCDLCRRIIHREEPRWRCAYHCSYDVCDICHRKHTSGAGAQPPSALAAPAAPSRPPAASADQRPAGSSPPPPQGAAQDVQKRAWCTALHGPAEVSCWVVVYAAATLVCKASYEKILASRSPRLFPHVWLTEGIVALGGWICLWTTSRLWGLVREVGPDLPWKCAAVLGVAHGAELAATGFLLRAMPVVAQNQLCALTPVIVVAAALRTDLEAPSRALLAAVCCAALGACVACATIFDWERLWLLPLALFLGLVSAVRWILTQAWLAPPEWVIGAYPAAADEPSALRLAAQAVPAAAALGFELAFATDAGAYKEILCLAEPERVGMLLFAGAVSGAAQFAAEMRLAQLMSATFLAFLMPLQATLSAILRCLFQEVVETGGGASIGTLGLQHWGGAVLSIAATALYVVARRQEPAADAAGNYLRLEEGPGPARPSAWVPPPPPPRQQRGYGAPAFPGQYPTWGQPPPPPPPVLRAGGRVPPPPPPPRRPNPAGYPERGPARPRDR